MPRGKRRAKPSQGLTDHTNLKVYQDLLKHDLSSSDSRPHPNRPLKRPAKRRKIVEKGEEHSGAPSSSPSPLVKSNDDRSSDGGASDEHLESEPSHGHQFAYTSSESSEESDVDWENLLDEPHKQGKEPENHERQHEGISLNLGEERAAKSKTSSRKRLPSSIADRQKRQNMHKIHVCCLLAHTYIRSAWCDIPEVQARLRSVLTDRIIGLLNPSHQKSQFDRSNSFISGLEEASKIWRGKFRITEEGMRKPHWFVGPDYRQASSISENGAVSSTKNDFIESASEHRGSRDVGAQLFCALLRSAGTDCRLVCSLQPLSLASTPQVQPDPPVNSNTIFASSNSTPSTLARTEGNDPYPSDAALANRQQDERSPSTPKPIRRLGRIPNQGLLRPDLGKPPSEIPSRKKRAPDSLHPIFWAEAFNLARQKWVPVDPLVKCTVAKASSFEPPGSDHHNDMTYVVAADEHGALRDVTKRYAKAYNAKTRKARVEATNDGDRWWRRALKIFRGNFEQDRDAIEDAELAKREASEPMPRNVQDFKDHPTYALERHLRRNQVIHPKREVGKLSVGKIAENVEAIYRRSDVHIVKSANKWYREGRDIQPGEQPIKYNQKQQRRGRSVSVDQDAYDQEDQSVPLYASYQTEVYVPPAVVRGKVPKNAFGNLDVYVPSMIPPGAVHVRASDAANAARIVRVDYADAVTGFKFKGRQGAAVVKGAVVAKEFRYAIEEVVQAFRYQRLQAEMDKKSQELLKNWKRFLLGLKIRERIMGSTSDAEQGDLQQEIDQAEVSEEKREQEGGFYMDKDQSVPAEPTAQQDVATGLVPSELQSMDLDVSGVDGSSGKHEYFEPTIISPWDVPRKPSTNERPPVPRQNATRHESASINELFEEDCGDEGAGGFIREASELAIDPDLANRHLRQNDPGGFSTDDARDSNGNTNNTYEDLTIGSIFQPDLDSKQEYEGRTDLHMLESSNDSICIRNDAKTSEPYDSPNFTLRQIEPHSSNSGSSEQSRPQPLQPATNKTLRENRILKTKSEEIPGMDDTNPSDDSLDEGSLISHDPEDEEAEPEWLVDEASL